MARGRAQPRSRRQFGASTPPTPTAPRSPLARRQPRITCGRDTDGGGAEPFGYDLVEADGAVTALGGAAYYGSVSRTSLVAPIVALVPTPDRKGYWLIGADGSVFPFGDAKNEGGAGGKVRADPVVGAAATPAATATGSSPRAARCCPSATPRATARSAHRKRPRRRDRATPDGKGTGSPAAPAASSPSVTPSTTARWRGRRHGPLDRRDGRDARRRRLLAGGSGGGSSTSATRVSLAPPKPRDPSRPSSASPSPPRHRRLDRRAGRHRPQPRHRRRSRLARRRAASPVTAIAAMPIPLPPPRPLAYDLAEADGSVSALGGAAYYGSARGTKLVAPIVALVPTPDRKGYWLDRRRRQRVPVRRRRVRGRRRRQGAGGPGRRRRRDAGRRAATGSSPPGGGVLPFGDARSYGSIADPLNDRVVAIVATPDGRGYWIASSGGQVFNFGDASFYGSAEVASPAAGRRHGRHARRRRLLARRATGARRPPSATPPACRRRPRSSRRRPPSGSPSPRTAPGTGWPSRTARSSTSAPPTAHGSLTTVPRTSPVTSIAAMPVVAGRLAPASTRAGIVRLRHQLAPVHRAAVARRRSPLPGPPSYPAGTLDYTVAVVGVDGWAVGVDNPCLAAEVAVGRAGAKGTDGAPVRPLHVPQLARRRPTRSTRQGPDGTCAEFSGSRAGDLPRLQLRLQLGRGSPCSTPARRAPRRRCGGSTSRTTSAASTGRATSALNAITIQGALDYLHSQKLTAGIYSTSVQWQGITGGYVPTGPQIPIWVAGRLLDLAAYPAELRLLAAREARTVLQRAVRLRRRQDLAPAGDARARTTTPSTPTTPAEPGHARRRPDGRALRRRLVTHPDRGR